MLKILWNFVFQKIFKYVISRFFVKSWKIGFGVGVISCDFRRVFLRVHYIKQCIQHVCALMLQKRMSKKV